MRRLTTCRNALSVLDFLVQLIITAVGFANNFPSWITAGGLWGLFVVSTIARAIQKWERQDDVIECFRDAGELTEDTPLLYHDRADLLNTRSSGSITL